MSYDPSYSRSVKFSDDTGLHEEAVDLVGPRREFLRLLIEALPLSKMFEGKEGKMNLALDSTGMCNGLQIWQSHTTKALSMLFIKKS